MWEVDVDTDAELAGRFGDSVPVAVKDGREVLRTRVEAGSLREELGAS